MILFAACNNESKILKNGLTKPADLITEINIRVQLDSDNKEILDTLSIAKKFYNENNQITKREESFLFDNESMEIEFVYDENNMLQKEIVKLSYDTTVVNYFYEDSLVKKTSAITINSEFEYRQIANHTYNQNKRLRQIETTELYVDKKSKDTTLNTLELDTYNEDENLIQSRFTDYINSDRNDKIKYNYELGKLVKTESYNEKDSLIFITKFEYKMDFRNNWVERKTKINGKLKYIKTRTIEYK